MPHKRTRKRYLNCEKCGSEKKTKEQQYSPICRKCRLNYEKEKANEKNKTLTRTCILCGKEKPNNSDYFYWHTKNKYLKSICKECDDNRKNKWNHDNPDKKRLQGRKTYQNCKHTEKFQETQRRCRKRHYYNVIKKDPLLRLRLSIGGLVGMFLKSKGASKRGQSVVKKLNYTLNELKEHLEMQFDENMSWDNYGSYWDLDHFIPQSSFSFTSMDDPEFKICWGLDNLQPLEHITNIKKGNRIPTQEEVEKFKQKLRKLRESKLN